MRRFAHLSSSATRLCAIGWITADVRATARDLQPTKKVIALDVGLKYFYADSNGKIVEPPQYYRRAEKQLSRANRKKSKKFKRGQKQSSNYLKARNRYARKHLRVSRQRKGFVQREALRVIQSNDSIVYEDLNVKGMVKNRPPLPPLLRGARGVMRLGLLFDNG
jgi:putative transposase